MPVNKESVTDVRMVEKRFPLKEINPDATIEVGFKKLTKEKRQEYFRLFKAKPMVVGPRLRNLHTWFARRPCSTARALTLGAVLPQSVESESFLKSLGLKDFAMKSKRFGSTLIFYSTPDTASIKENVRKFMNKEPREIAVIDPMAGGGSIPLEALRLGFRTCAIEYNPVAYLVLKATVEFPARYADSGLFEETLKMSKEFIIRARQELQNFYTENEGYIFARGVKCTFCNGLIPIQGIDPVITDVSRFKKRFLKVSYDKKEHTFHAETTDAPLKQSSLSKRGSHIKCPYCDNWFQLRGKAKSGATAFDVWFNDHARLMKQVVEEFVPVNAETEEKLLDLHIPLVKQVGNSFSVAWNEEDEREKFVNSLRALSDQLLELQEYIPLEDIPLDNRWAITARRKNLTKWYMLFNPRQLLAVAKLSKLVNEIAQKLESKNGDFGAAVATYIAFTMSKMIDYNTIATMWNRPRASIVHTFRGESTLDFRREYAEASPIFKNLPWALETDIAESNNLARSAGGILPILRFLCDEFRGSDASSRINLYMGDATQLSSMLGQASVDVLNVDPPYFEQVIYSDRSELFWVILRRTLAPYLERLFKPGLKLTSWSWTNQTVPREREVVEGKFEKFFEQFIDETSKTLKNNGTFLLWFTHPTAEAWRIVSSALYEANYVVPKVWPLQTEYKMRFKRQWNVAVQEMSLTIVSRKYERQKLLEVSPQDVKNSVIENPLFKKVVEETVEDTRKIIVESNASPADTAALMFGTALSVASRFELPIGAKFSDLYDTAITAVVSKYVQPLIYKVLTETAPLKIDPTTSQKIEKHITQGMLIDPATRSYLTLWLISRVDLATAKIRQEPLGLHFDLVQTVGKLCGFGLDNLKQYGLITERTIDKAGKAYHLQFLEMLTLAGGKASLDRLTEVAPGMATILARSALTESGDPTVRAKTIKAKMSMKSDRELASNAALSVILLETTRDQDLGYRTADKAKISGYLPGMDESEMARLIRELAIKTLTQLIF